MALAALNHFAKKEGFHLIISFSFLWFIYLFANFFTLCTLIWNIFSFSQCTFLFKTKSVIALQKNYFQPGQNCIAMKRNIWFKFNFCRSTYSNACFKKDQWWKKSMLRNFIKKKSWKSKILSPLDITSV